MASIDRKKAFSAPESEFRLPQAVVQSRELSYDDKVAVLSNWKQGLIQLQKASEENMLDERGTNDMSTRLAAVTQAITELKKARA
jgi:predicted Zn-dependent protease